MIKRPDAESIWFWSITVMMLAAYWLIYIQPFFPNFTGGLGHDYQSSLAEAVIGYIHFERGNGLAWPWFTPATCGGNMFIAGVANPYLNTQQWLTFITDALTAARLNFILFAALGYVGCYRLLRGPFGLDTAGAVTGAAIFLFNGFFAYRMIIGHTGFHSFMLVPAIAVLLLSDKDRFSTTLVAGLLLTYVTLASGIYSLMPVVLSVAGLLLIHQLRHGAVRWLSYRAFAGALFIAFLISLFKISLALSVTDNITRDQYPLPGIPGIATSLLLPVRLLFFSTPDWLSETRFLFTNYAWNIDRHELEFGVGWVTLLLVLFGIVMAARRGLQKVGAVSWLIVSALIAILLLPILLNYYDPAWNGLIKQLPVLKSFSMFTRLYAVYIPLIAVAAALSFSFVGSYRKPAAFLFVFLLVGTATVTDKHYYHQQSYDPSLLVDYDRSFRTDVLKPPDISRITNVAAISYDDKPLRVRNETFVYGASNMNCHNDMFGYRLEGFPGIERLQPETAVTLVTDGVFNLKNPACYVFPATNNCEPGDHFQADEQASVESFRQYRGFPFQMPVYQRVTNWLSLGTFIVVMLTLIIRTWLGRRPGSDDRSPSPGDV